MSRDVYDAGQDGPLIGDLACAHTLMPNWIAIWAGDRVRGTTEGERDLISFVRLNTAEIM